MCYLFASELKVWKFARDIQAIISCLVKVHQTEEYITVCVVFAKQYDVHKWNVIFDYCFRFYEMSSLLEAIDNKYGKEDNYDLDFPIAIYVPRKSPRNSIPSLLVLNDCDIETAGDEQELEKKCQGVEELDLAQNKLKKWTEVC
jgi:hypothetical protein